MALQGQVLSAAADASWDPCGEKSSPAQLEACIPETMTTDNVAALQDESQVALLREVLDSVCWEPGSDLPSVGGHPVHPRLEPAVRLS